MTPGEVAALWKVDSKTATRWGKSGRLLVVRTPGNQQRFLQAEVEALIRGEPPEVARKLGIEQRDRLAGEARA
jgi:predicted site-specific integrase-resolvase